MMHGCIAYPCAEPRYKNSGFCKAHKEEHDKSPWVKAWLAYQKECARVGVKEAVFSPPRKDADG